MPTIDFGQGVDTIVADSGSPGFLPPASGDPSATDVDPATWREIDLRMPDPDHPGEYVDIDLLEPVSWIVENHAAAGGWIDLSLPEMKVRGLAEVVSIEACPPIESGDGRVIVGTFTHVARNVYDLRLAGLADPIGVTFNHPFWSLDRGGWTSAGDLRPGEHVATETGNAVVQSVVAEPGEHRVYNIEVETDHRYLVSRLAVLVHNMSPGNFVKQYRRPETAFRSINENDAKALLSGEGISRVGGRRGVEAAACPFGTPVPRFFRLAERTRCTREQRLAIAGPLRVGAPTPVSCSTRIISTLTHSSCMTDWPLKSVWACNLEACVRSNACAVLNPLFGSRWNQRSQVSDASNRLDFEFGQRRNSPQ